MRALWLLLSLAVISAPLCALASNQASAIKRITSQYPWYQWQTVGQATLTWGLWDIYNSELKTPTGKYSGLDTDLALIIRYLRDIDKDDLLQATNEQWLHLGYSKQQITPWLTTLSAIWPNVKKGDRLIFVQRNGIGQFYQGTQPLGKPLSKSLTRSFIAIWLSPKTDYPELRKQLIN
ncbi:chalcone isomerase family protein [Photobacterium leiognathi]|uniref:hypothetical protein n=1 Tax=Photobacterium leiognathi TaxID=553611 RepID=UPI002981F913|nr:hypothetical protein [Photobacterium leiognathi]